MLDARPGAPAGSRHDLSRLLDARSVAVVGASDRPGSFGRRMMTELIGGGFTGVVFPVNPRYDEVLGLRCLASLESLPEPADLVLLGVPNAVVEDQLMAAAARGCGAAVVFASGYLEDDSEPRLPERLRDIAVGAGMELCGCNCMGFVNVEAPLRACGFYQPPSLDPGGIALLCHSGSVFSAMLHNHRGLRFNLVVSVGTELVTGIPAYMHHALSRPTTRVIALFIETIRDPSGFEGALGAAAAAQVPVVALKVGTSERSKALVTAHTGALAGDDGAIEALFDAYGVTSVGSLDEMADTLEVFGAASCVDGGVASVHDSGGERAMFVEVAERTGVPVAAIGDTTKGRLAEVLEPGLEPDNPLDAWGTGNASDAIFRDCMDILLDDPAVGLLVFCADLTAEDDPSLAYVDVVADVHRRASKPVVVVANLASGIDPGSATRLRAAGVAVLEGTVTASQALRHVYDRSGFVARSRREPRFPDGTVAQDAVAAMVERSRGQAEVLRVLRSCGIPVVDTIEAADPASVLAAAETIGYPVALKSDEGAAHKAEAGGVRLGLGDDAALGAAYADLAARLGPRVVVQAMAPPGLELALGSVRDPTFGPVVMAGAGGVFIEVLADRRFVRPPVDVDRAREVLEDLALVRGLRQRRHGALPDLGCAAEALARFSLLAADLPDDIAALDVNPLVVGREGCVAVDALVVRGTP